MTGTAAMPKEWMISDEDLRRKLAAMVGPLPELNVKRDNTALLVIDVQYMDAHRDFGFGAKAKALGGMEFLDYYWDRLETMVIPNIQRLLAAARAQGVEVVHVHVAASKADGRDNSIRFKSKGRPTPIQSKDAEILPEVAPLGDELVISKTTESVFNSTNIDRLLRNMGIANVIVVGVVTNGCVEGAVRGAAERDYGTILVEDAAAALAPQLHEMAIVSMGHKDAAIKSTEEVVRALEAL
jgi:nicotinamidase-related amidase